MEKVALIIGQFCTLPALEKLKLIYQAWISLILTGL